MWFRDRRYATATIVLWERHTTLVDLDYMYGVVMVSEEAIVKVPILD